MSTEIRDHAAAPKYLQLASRLRRQVESGALKPGDRLPSFAEMRSQFGANAATVERVYKVLEQDNLIVRRHRRGVFVASPQSRAKTGIIGVTGITFSSRRHPYHGQFLEGVQEAAARAGWEILLLNPEPVIKWEKVDGVLNHDPNLEIILPLLPPCIPFVSTLAPVRGKSNVLADEVDSVQEVMSHLLEWGHRRIAYLVTIQGAPLLQPRVSAYQNTLRQAGIEPQKPWLRDLRYEPSYYECAKRRMRGWIEDDWKELKCTALLAQNDAVAIGAIEALREAGIEVPRDVSVVGFDGAGVDEHFSPRLTTVEVPLREIGERAVEMLVRQMQQESEVAPLTLMLPARLKVRDSTRAVG